jgi:hypothetical protein
MESGRPVRARAVHVHTLAQERTHRRNVGPLDGIDEWRISRRSGADGHRREDGQQDGRTP